jgi:hypothetical protein
MLVPTVLNAAPHCLLDIVIVLDVRPLISTLVPPS